MIGKYNSARDAVAHRAGLDGTAETLGDVADFGHYSLVTELYGRDAIVAEDSQGFVTVDWYRAGESAEPWKVIECSYSVWCDEL